MPYKNLNRNIEIIEIAENTYTFVATKEYLIQNNIKIKNIDDLENYPLIIPMEGSTARNILNTYLNKADINSQYEIVSEDMRKDFAIYEDEYRSIKGKFKHKQLLNFILKSALEIDSHEEFELTVRNYEITTQNKKLKKRNSKLKKEIKKYKRNNAEILNSTSWKLTNPFRKITNTFKKLK